MNTPDFALLAYNHCCKVKSVLYITEAVVRKKNTTAFSCLNLCDTAS